MKTKTIIKKGDAVRISLNGKRVKGIVQKASIGVVEVKIDNKIEDKDGTLTDMVITNTYYVKKLNHKFI